MPSRDDLLAMYERMALIREMEETVVRLVGQNRIPGTVHPYIGEEAIAVGVCSVLRPDDFIASTHRGHGHVLAKGGDPKAFLAELYGKSTGYCKGKGGSMHVAALSLGILGANAIVGGNTPIVGGAALASQILGVDRVAVSFVGDGAIDTGALHEAVSLSALWNVPAIFVCENNGFTEFVPRARLQRAQRVVDRASGYAIPTVRVDGNDIVEVYAAAGEAVERARGGDGPTFIEAVSYRTRGHFVGDPEDYRPPGDLESWRDKDPLDIAERHLLGEGWIDEELKDQIWTRVRDQVKDAVDFAEASPFPEPEAGTDGVYTDLVVEGWS